MDIHIDFETRSFADIRKVGSFRYAEDPTTESLTTRRRARSGEDVPARSSSGRRACPLTVCRTSIPVLSSYSSHLASHAAR